MPEDVAVIDAVDSAVDDVAVDESSQSTTDDVPRGTQDPQQLDKQDNRRAPDALRKHIADLRRQAEAITDPVEKKSALDRIKLLYDTTGKARGYEEQFPTVREAREVKALLDTVGGREGFLQMQATLSEIEQIDNALAAGDPSVAQRMWDEAPEGMPKIMPALLDKFAQANPQEYQKFIIPKSIGILDQAGFPKAFDKMVKLYNGGKLEDANAIRDELIQWVASNRQQATQQRQADPEVERLRTELDKLKQGGESQKVDQAYNTVVDHAGPTIDQIAKPIIGKFGLTREENQAFRQAVWNHLQETRNSNETYKTVAPAKQRQGYESWVEYAKRWTQDNADASIRAVLKTPPWSRLTQNGTKPNVHVTKSPVTPNIQQGKEPAPSEIDYSGKGLQMVRKAGFKDIQDAILSGQAPLKTGTMRKWR